jgi:hypothetical protein
VKEKYDYVLFMESFPVMSVKLFQKLYSHAKNLTKKGGSVYCFHNLEEKPSLIRSIIKPMLCYLVGIDFGRFTTTAQMKTILPNAKFEILATGTSESLGKRSFKSFIDLKVPIWYKINIGISYFMSSIGINCKMNQFLVSETF